MQLLRSASVVAVLWCSVALFSDSTAHAAAAPNDAYLPPLEPPPAASTTRTTYALTTEADLATWPTWSDIEAATQRHTTLTRGSFSGAGGIKIHYRLYTLKSGSKAPARGGVVISSGRTEGLAMYQELIHDLVRNGYSVYIHDHRGQGFSQRMLSSDTTMGYVDSFDNYVKDLASFIHGPVRTAHANAGTPLFLLAHSMGGTIASLYLESERDTPVAAAALVTPMMQPWVAPQTDASVAVRLADAYCENHSTAGSGPLLSLVDTQYADGTDFDTAYAALQRQPEGAYNDLTHSGVRFARHGQARNDARCEGADCGSPHAKIGGVSYRWLNEACAASRLAHGEQAAQITRPVLLLQGEQDRVVKPAEQKMFCEQVNRGRGAGYCIGRNVPDARHSIFIEADRYRGPALQRVLGFFDCVRAGKGRCE